MKNSVTASGISKSYTEQPALHEIDFSAQPGEIFGFIGADGAGKTTLFKILYHSAENGCGKGRSLRI